MSEADAEEDSEEEPETNVLVESACSALRSGEFSKSLCAQRSNSTFDNAGIGACESLTVREVLRDVIGMAVRQINKGTKGTKEDKETKEQKGQESMKDETLRKRTKTGQPRGKTSGIKAREKRIEIGLESD